VEKDDFYFIVQECNADAAHKSNSAQAANEDD
jgi:hypothetical protein